MGIYLIALRSEGDLIDRIVDRRMTMLVHAAPAQPSGLPDTYVVARASARELLPPRLRELAPGRHLVAGERQIEHALVRDEGEMRLIVTYGDGAHSERLQHFRRALLVLAVVCLVAAAVLARSWAHALLVRRPALRRRLHALDPSPDAAGAQDLRARLAMAYSSLQQDLLAPMDRERQFVANVGHELRTPITLILTGCELLLGSPGLREKDRAHLRRMSAAAEHMGESVRSFMILAREGNLGQSEPVELLACVLESLALHRAALDERRITVRANVGAEVSVVANREALFVVVNNLVKNAVKYTDSGGVSIHHLGNTLYVADTGCGIPEGELANIFLPFYRTRWATESGRDGLGLGLAIVKRICDHYGWTVDVRSTEGKGTTVSVEFRTARPLFR